MKTIPRPTRRGWVLCGGGLSLALGGALSGFIDLMRAGIFALTLCVLAWLLVFIRPALRQIERSYSAGRLQVGRPADITVRWQTPRGYPVGGVIRDPHRWGGANITEPPQPATQIPRIEKGPASFTYEITPPHRGECVIGPLSFSTQDPLGLMTGTRGFGAEDRLFVWPHVRPLETGAALVRGFGDDALMSAHATHSGLAGTSVRQYAEGDDMRIVHWGATAHRGELMVRQFDPPSEEMSRIIVTGNVPTAGSDAAWEWLLSAAASLIMEFDRHGIRLDVTVGDSHTDTAPESLDALAKAGESVVENASARSVPTIAFHHTSAPGRLTAPHHGTALAFVGGSQSRSAATALSELGWQCVEISGQEDVAEVLTAYLDDFGRGNR